MIPLLYLSSSSYSGSTLLSFLLNEHPEITTVGEAEGWRYASGETFRCSCGAPLPACPLFADVASAFRADGLPFDFRDFGTRYRLAANDRLDRYLGADLPIASTTLELLRDGVVRRLPTVAARLARHDRANVLLAQTVLAAMGGRVFLDASKNAYRLRHLRRVPGFEVRVIHLVRDPRGVVASNMRKKAYSAALAIRLWLRDQCTIARIAHEQPGVLTVRYEDLCASVDATIARIHSFVGVRPVASVRNADDVPHHILGNEMRLGRVAAIANDVRWMRELSAGDLDVIATACRQFRQRHPEHGVSGLIAQYGCDVGRGTETETGTETGSDGSSRRPFERVQ